MGRGNRPTVGSTRGAGEGNVRGVVMSAEESHGGGRRFKGSRSGRMGHVLDRSPTLRYITSNDSSRSVHDPGDPTEGFRSHE